MYRCSRCGKEWGPPSVSGELMCSPCWREMAEASRQYTKKALANRPKAGVFVSILGVLAGVVVAVITAWLTAFLVYLPGDPLAGENGPVVLFVGFIGGYIVYHRIRYRPWW